MSKLVRKVKGFTLIELLVVIAIIGILASLLFPAIAGAIAKTKATRQGSDGRQLAIMLYGENLDREARSQNPIWPCSTNVGSTATAYFKFWGTIGALQTTPSMVSGPEMPVCQTTNWNDLATEQVAWKIVKDPMNRDEMPLLISRNVKDPTQTSWELDPLIKPFGTKFAVVVSHQGKVDVLVPDKQTGKIEGLKYTLTGLEMLNP